MNVIAEIPRNCMEEMKVNLTQYHGYELLDIRVWYRDNEEDWRPSRKGVSIRVENIPELQEAITIAGRLAGELG